MRLKLSIALCALLASCKSLPPPPDIYVFGDLKTYMTKDPVTGHVLLKPNPVCVKKIGEPECGHGISIVTGKEVYIGEKVLFNKKKWSDLRTQSILLPAEESYAPLATYLINSCKKFDCSEDITKFKIKIDSVVPKK